jgi:hypothetical protein
MKPSFEIWHGATQCPFFAATLDAAKDLVDTFHANDRIEDFFNWEESPRMDPSEPNMWETETEDGTFYIIERRLAK